jgi:hypothetical protein
MCAIFKELYIFFLTVGDYFNDFKTDLFAVGLVNVCVCGKKIRG